MAESDCVRNGVSAVVLLICSINSINSPKTKSNRKMIILTDSAGQKKMFHPCRQELISKKKIIMKVKPNEEAHGLLQCVGSNEGRFSAFSTLIRLFFS